MTWRLFRLIFSCFFLLGQGKREEVPEEVARGSVLIENRVGGEGVCGREGGAKNTFSGPKFSLR